MMSHSDDFDFLGAVDTSHSPGLDGGKGQRRPSSSRGDPRLAKRVRWGDDGTRTRVSRACDRCKTRKTRCSGKFPCSTCSQANLDCQFTAPYRRGRLPSIEPCGEATAAGLVFDDTPGKPNCGRRQDLATGQNAALPVGALVGPDETTATSRTAPHRPAGDRSTITNRSCEEVSSSKGRDVSRDLETLWPEVASSRNSPEPSQTDRQGRYVGASSGVCFPLRLQRTLQAQIPPGTSDSSIFTFGDMPLPNTDPTLVILPPKIEADDMVRRYFDFAHATNRFLHRPTVEEWLTELYETNGTMRDRDTAHSRTALLFMVFALSTSFSSSDKHPAPSAADAKRMSHAEATVSSVGFFSAAEHHLTAERGRLCLTRVQARLAQCFYLLAHSRLNHCWTLFGAVAHLILALGIHRGTCCDPSPSALLLQRTDQIESECRKRTFWCAYNLDIYLSSVLGRPRTFHDDDIDQELPACVDDSHLSRRRNHFAPMPAARSHSIMTGPVALHKLSQILAGVLRDLYSIKPPSRAERLRLAGKYTKLLSEWRGQVAYLLDSSGDSSMFVPIVRRQRDVLKLAFWHAQILVHRPFLLENFASLPTHGNKHAARTSTGSAEADENVGLCLDAATSIARLIHDINSAEQLSSTMFLIPYYGFSAVTVLYVHAILQRDAPPEHCIAAFRAATVCQDHLSSVAIQGTLTERYSVVLQELRNEVLRHCPYLALVTVVGMPDTSSPGLGHDGLASGGMNGAAPSPVSGGAAQMVNRSRSHLSPGQAARQRRRPSAPSNPGQKGGREKVRPLATADSDGDVGRADLSLSPGSALDSDLQQLFQTSVTAHTERFAVEESSSRSSGSPRASLTGLGQFESLVIGGMMERSDALLADWAMENWDMTLHRGVGA
ncbi:hypothetical protein MAPG_11907 [Magnaporthiopsis poae ATCC 64411]|uniref:Zn(2)-C6 fungal-type domain-containing protein n=1 Tax=Magnaporthiopsis poae (strain ATCC 64411 / 73-15) TaxID=644358 RepID=A0A0C4EGG7_MAGP6|nr:hypothetical protein MAPG_11907 [Magnaporthiopsis poae ATCC 64411]